MDGALNKVSGLVISMRTKLSFAVRLVCCTFYTAHPTLEQSLLVFTTEPGDVTENVKQGKYLEGV